MAKKKRLKGKQKPTSIPVIKQSPFLTKADQAYHSDFTEDLANGVTLEMVAIPGGRFLMGSPYSEPERSDSEGPQHTVTLQPFFMGKFPVTQAQWQAVASLPKVNIDLDPDPSNLKGTNRPVERVSWYEAVEFCARLSKAMGREYRLPSEAQWEYACRAGTTTPFHFGKTISPDLANYNGNYTYASGSKGIYREQTTEVGSFPANAFGLYDMHGLVWEWCADHRHISYDGAPTDGSVWLSENEYNYRVLRGGSWYSEPRYCRSACRYDNMPDDSRRHLHRFSGCGCAWVSTPIPSELVDGNLPGVQRESRPAPVIEATLSENKPESGSLVGCKVEQLSDSTTIPTQLSQQFSSSLAKLDITHFYSVLKG